VISSEPPTGQSKRIPAGFLKVRLSSHHAFLPSSKAFEKVAIDAPRLGLVGFDTSGYNEGIRSRKRAPVNVKSNRSDQPNRSAKGKPRSADDKPRVRQIGSLVNQLMSRRGYAQVMASDAIHQAIASVLDPHLKAAFQVGNLRGGILQVYATDSVSMQELNFRKRAMLKHLQKTLPESKVTDLRFRIQS
jgi:hypothetical protein